MLGNEIPPPEVLLQNCRTMICINYEYDKQTHPMFAALVSRIGYTLV